MPRDCRLKRVTERKKERKKERKVEITGRRDRGRKQLPCDRWGQERILETETRSKLALEEAVDASQDELRNELQFSICLYVKSWFVTDSWSRKFPAFYGTPRSVTASLSHMNLNQTIPTYWNKVRFPPGLPKAVVKKLPPQVRADHRQIFPLHWKDWLSVADWFGLGLKD